MKLLIVSIFDAAAGAYNRPYFSPSLGLAIRSFTDESNRDHPENPMFAHPADFALMHLGFFDDNTGLLQTLEGGPKSILRASESKS